MFQRLFPVFRRVAESDRIDFILHCAAVPFPQSGPVPADVLGKRVAGASGLLHAGPAPGKLAGRVAWTIDRNAELIDLGRLVKKSCDRFIEYG